MPALPDQLHKSLPVGRGQRVREPLPIALEDPAGLNRLVFVQGGAAMIRNVYEVDPMVCPKCGGSMKVVAFITDYAAVDRIIDHLNRKFVAEKPPPSRVFEQVALMAAEDRAEYR